MQISETVFTSLAARGACAPEEEACLRLLEELHIPFEGRTHDRADTIELCESIEKKLGAPIVKNLFLCNRQQTVFYLLIMPGNKPFKTKYLSEQIGSARLSFAGPEHMERLLGVKPGSASILALMNDKARVYGEVKADKLRLKDLTGIFLPALGVTPAVVELPTE